MQPSGCGSTVVTGFEGTVYLGVKGKQRKGIKTVNRKRRSSSAWKAVVNRRRWQRVPSLPSSPSSLHWSVYESGPSAAGNDERFKKQAEKENNRGNVGLAVAVKS